ncbi:ABC transporter permease [Chryseolinea sp. H1M3-3]|uniref:ABC transporter permease n=1 Tax=Chryseolinea sp. H1M3-3 TaxID=3034144 RepID=UPI0023ED5E7E|nr:ABC transporter permease [Chryseolinea sp. H1M3-3]
MFKNFLKTILRSLLREKGNTLINIAGLTLGITGSLVLFLIIKEGNSFDKYHSKKDRIYRIISKSNGNDGTNFTQAIPPPLPEAFKDEFNETEEVVFMSYRRGSLITIPQHDGDVKKYEEPKGVVFTEPTFFKIFDRKIIAGTAEKGLDDPNEAIISKAFARKYFQTENVLGKTVVHDNIEYKITAVMEDFPSNTDLPFELMLSYNTIRKSYEERGWHNLADTDNCYFLLKENSTIAQVEQKIPQFATKYFGDGDRNPTAKTFVIQPLSSIHSDMRGGNYNTRMPKEAFYVFSIIAIFLIVTACINFINLTTAEAIKKTKEVGIRKILGGTRSQLILQFLGEAFIVTCIAASISLGAAQVFLVFINTLLESSLTLNLLEDVTLWLFLIILISAITLFSGLYPAFVVSGFKPVSALKTQLNNKNSSGYMLRRSLVVLQFFISQFFIIGTLVLSKQLNFFQQQDVGFNKDAIIVVPIPRSEEASGPNKMRSLKNELLRLPRVEKASLNYAPPSFRAVKSSSITVNGEPMEVQVKEVDGDYIDLYSIDIIAGAKLGDIDSVTAAVVNEKFVQQAGFKSNDDILGKEFDFWGNNLPIKGVVKNFNTTSLERAIEPVVLLNNINEYQSLSIKINPVDMQGTIDEVKSRWEEAYPEYIFKYEFLDEQIQNLYKGERRISTLLTIFSSIAIIIGCLGLFGLVSFMANQKVKEIGVRKVLGASVESILILFSKEFVKLILIGFLLAAPIAGILMHKLLQEFAYKITIGPSIFLSGIGITLLIAFITVGYRSAKAAMANPAESLRSE